MIGFNGGWDDYFLLLSLPTIIAIISAFRWPFMKLFTDVYVDLSLVGLK